MRPNRRSGFQHLGSTYEFSTKLLVAVDVSGSIHNSEISQFYSVINRFFKYGVQTIDVVQFDTMVGKVRTLKKAKKEIDVKGRGGTNVQIVFDYLKENNHYDGLIIFTDGYTGTPKLNFKTRAKILWICNNERNYNRHKEWMLELGRACWIGW